MNKIQTGQKAEDQAAAFLQAQGYRLVERNFRAKVGEIDLIMRDGDEIVFVEVRARRSHGFGGAAASVDGAKRRKVTRTAALWLQARSWDGPCRFDVVALDGAKIEHIPDAFTADR
ncbi:MAG: YraN family protein [Elusimicrobia bacterium]|nr:YraN family protein [Elusimicrobiota bacterium]